MKKTKTTTPESLYITNLWARHVIQPITIATLVTALFTSLLAVIDATIPIHPWMLVTFLIFGIALEAVYTSFWIEHPDRRSLDRTAYRLAEFGVLLVCTRFFTLLVGGSGLPTLDEFRLYLREPIAFINDGFFLLAALLVLAAWQMAISQARIFIQMAITPAEARYYILPPHEQARSYHDKPIHVQRGELMASFFRTWVWGGVIMVIAVAISTIDLAATRIGFFPLSIARLGIQPILVLALIAYFLAGFWLLSQGRLQMMNARWLMSGVGKDIAVEQRWRRSSLLVLLAIAFLAAFLPIGSTLPISRFLQIIVNGIVYAANLIWYLAILFIFSLISLFSSDQAESTPVAPTITPVPTREFSAQQTTSSSIDPVSQLLFSSFFWTVIIFLAVTAFLYFLRERGVVINGRTLKSSWQRILDRLRLVRLSLTTQTKQVARTIRRRISRKKTSPALPDTSAWRFIRVNALTPRDQVRYFYLSLVRRATETGVARQESETPLEYGHDLKQNWPEYEEEIQELTDAFLKARYSVQPVEKGLANAVKTRWKRLRSTLRRNLANSNSSID